MSELSNPALFLEDEIINEISAFHRKSAKDRRLVKKAKKRNHRGSNFKTVKAKPGWKRVKVGEKKYVRVRMTSAERVIKKRVGKALGHAAKRLKK